MKLRIQKVCLLRQVFDAMPLSVRMIIEGDTYSFQDNGSHVSFELIVGIVERDTPAPGVRYTNTYFCDRDQVEWCLTDCGGPEEDLCPDCGRSLMCLMSESDGVISEFSESSLREAFQRSAGDGPKT